MKTFKKFKKFIKDEAPTMSVASGNIAGFDIPPVRKKIQAVLKRKKLSVNEKP